MPPTSDRRASSARVSGIRPGGATALFDALYAGTLLASGRGRSLLVLFTDGEDNLSWLDAAQVRRVLLESNVLVQAVGIVPARRSDRAYPERLAAAAAGAAARAHAPAARRGHGRPVLGRHPRPSGSRDAFLAILEAMKTRYVLRFEPDRVRREGLHELDVRLVRRKGKVHCRKAYFVGPPAP